MLRAAALTLLVVSLVMGCVQAQRTGMGFQGVSAGPSARSAFAAPSHLASFPRRGALSFHRHRHGHGPFFYPYYFPYDYYPYDEAIDYERPTEVVEHEAEPTVISPPAPQVAPPKAQVIDIPAAANSASAKPRPPTIFILANGEHLETSRFLLTAANLSVNVDRRQRTIPLDQLNLDATIAANHERGINLRVPADQNEILLRF